MSTQYSDEASYGDSDVFPRLESRTGNAGTPGPFGNAGTLYKSGHTNALGKSRNAGTLGPSGDTDTAGTPGPFGNSGPLSPFFTSPSHEHETSSLPPTAMFSVTSRPQRSVSPTKSGRTLTSSESSNKLLINRLVITGRRGAPILDHSWKTPQRIRVGQKLQARPNINHFDLSHVDTEPLGSKQHHDSHQDRPTGDGPLPYLKRHLAPADEVIPEKPWIDAPNEPVSLLPAPASTDQEPTLTATFEGGATTDGIDVPEDLAPDLLEPLQTRQVTHPAHFLLPT